MADQGELKDLTPFQGMYRDQWQKGQVKVPGDVRPEQEDPLWYLTWAKYLYGQYCNNYTLICPGGFVPSMHGGRSLTELQLYGRGMQPVEKYKRQINRKDFKGVDGKKMGLVNISWDLHQVYRKFREILIDRVMSVEHEPGIVAIDKPSLRKKNMAAANDRFAAMTESKSFYQQVGKTPEGVNDEIMGMTPTDVDVLEQLGGYQTLAEITLRECVQASLQFSNYDPELKRPLIENLIDIGFCATTAVHDPVTGKQMVEYVDPATLILPRSQYDDGRDIDYFGRIQSMSISALRQQSGDDLTEEQILHIAKLYRNQGGNGHMDIDFGGNDMGQRSAYTPKYDGAGAFDQMQINVMTFYFVALDVERYVVGYHKSGNAIFDKVKRGSELTKKDEARGKAVKDNVIQYMYKAKWVVGTDIVFNYGVDDVVTRSGSPGAMKANPPLALYRLNQPSITSACIGAIDDLQLAIFKKRHALTTTPPMPNMGIDYSILEDSLNLGGLKLSMQDLIEIYQITGFLHFKSKSPFAGAGEGSQRSPLFPISDNTTNMLLALQNEINEAVNNLRLISGVNEMADGSGNPKDVLNGVAAGMDTASNRSISGLYTAMMSHYKSMARMLALRYQSLSVYGGDEMHYLPVGSSVAVMLKLYPDFALIDLDISVKPAMDNNSRQMLMQALITNRDGGKIEEHTFLSVLKLIQTGRVEMAQFVLAKGVQEKSKRDEQQQIAIMQAQSEAQAGQAQAAEAAKQATFSLQGELDAKQIVLTGGEARKTAEQAHDFKMKEIALQSELAVASGS